MRHFFENYADDIAGFLGGATFSIGFASDLIGSITHIIAVGLIGGCFGVIGKELGAYLVKSYKNFIK